MEIFKESKKSICHTCFNIDKECGDTFKTCGTDSKICKAFVQTCNYHNKDFNISNESISKTIAIKNKPDTRSECIGGKV